jgi:hypothetical protein
MPTEPEPTDDYRFPSPTERLAWQTAVNKAIAAGDLTWTHLGDTRWELHGTCPHCRHTMSQLVDTDVIVGGPMNVTFSFRRDGPTFGTEVVCNCQPRAPHRKDTRGCGYGKNLMIAVSVPDELGAEG